MGFVDATSATINPRARRRRLLRKRFLRRPLAIVGLVVALTFIVCAILAPVDRAVLGKRDRLQRPARSLVAASSARHGRARARRALADHLGRSRVDRSRRVLDAARDGGRGARSAIIAGYYRGWVDAVIARLTDVLLAFPFLIVAVGLAAILGPSLTNATIALGIGAAPALIRVARGEALALREEDYVRAAVANGASDARILIRHVLPNMLSTLIVQATVAIPAAIIGEAVLSFLGLGVQPPTPSWGVMLADAQSYLSQAPRLAVYPGIAIFLCSLSFNLLGDGLRDIFDPRTTR